MRITCTLYAYYVVVNAYTDSVLSGLAILCDRGRQVQTICVTVHVHTAHTEKHNVGHHKKGAFELKLIAHLLTLHAAADVAGARLAMHQAHCP